jgi:hypothetical protein
MVVVYSVQTTVFSMSYISIKSVISNTRIILHDIGLSYVWLNQYVANERAFIADATALIQAVFLQENYAIINTSNKCLIYRYLTDNVCLQNYLSKILDRSQALYVTSDVLSIALVLKQADILIYPEICECVHIVIQLMLMMNFTLFENVILFLIFVSKM